MVENRISLKLLELRQQHNLTQKQLCEELNISRANYSYFENGKRTPDISILMLIAKYYNVSLDELVTGTCSETNKSVTDTSIYDSGITLARHLQAKHIPIENVMELSKSDFDFLMVFKELSADNQSELRYLINYKMKKQSN